MYGRQGRSSLSYENQSDHSQNFALLELFTAFLLCIFSKVHYDCVGNVLKTLLVMCVCVCVCLYVCEIRICLLNIRYIFECIFCRVTRQPKYSPNPASLVRILLGPSHPAA